MMKRDENKRGNEASVMQNELLDAIDLITKHFSLHGKPECVHRAQRNTFQGIKVKKGTLSM